MDNLDDMFDGVNLCDYLMNDFNLQEEDAVFIASCAEYFVNKIGLDMSNPMQGYIFLDSLEEFFSLIVSSQIQSVDISDVANNAYDPKFIASHMVNFRREELVSLMEKMGFDSPREF